MQIVAVDETRSTGFGSWALTVAAKRSAQWRQARMSAVRVSRSLMRSFLQRMTAHIHFDTWKRLGSRIETEAHDICAKEGQDTGKSCPLPAIASDLFKGMINNRLKIRGNRQELILFDTNIQRMSRRQAPITDRLSSKAMPPPPNVSRHPPRQRPEHRPPAPASRPSQSAKKMAASALRMTSIP